METTITITSEYLSITIILFIQKSLLYITITITLFPVIFTITIKYYYYPKSVRNAYYFAFFLQFFADAAKILLFFYSLC